MTEHRHADRGRNSERGPRTALQLKVFVPTETLVDEPVTKVIAEAENGSFCLLPRHVDFVAALVPGILIFTTQAGEECFLAVDVGTLVKAGDEVRISTLNAVYGADLERLKQTVEESFQTLDEHEREARSALARLEAGTLRRFFSSEVAHS
jgi:F-type H+-transporting ATPase subunit epsilon